MARRIYVPILKGKQGEYGSLKELSERYKACVTPLIEVPKDVKYTQIEKIADKLEDCWGTKRVIFLDLGKVPIREQKINDVHPVSYVLNACREKGIQIIPVAGIGRDNDYQVAVNEAVVQDRRGVCIRLIGGDFKILNGRLESKLDDLLATVGVTPTETDLLIDLGWIGSNGIEAKRILRDLPRPQEWRSLILAATAFPRDLSGIKANSIKNISRVEWIVWKELAENPKAIQRLPIFGDYGICHPELVEVDHKFMSVSASLRYTVESDWVIVRGRSVRKDKDGYKQSHKLCRQLIQRPEYTGKGFSWGDWWIWSCAAEEVGPGSSTTWRKVGTSHHLTFVVEQIASFHESGGTI